LSAPIAAGSVSSRCRSVSSIRFRTRGLSLAGRWQDHRLAGRWQDHRLLIDDALALDTPREVVIVCGRRRSAPGELLKLVAQALGLASSEARRYGPPGLLAHQLEVGHHLCGSWIVVCGHRFGHRSSLPVVVEPRHHTPAAVVTVTPADVIGGRSPLTRHRLGMSDGPICTAWAAATATHTEPSVTRICSSLEGVAAIRRPN
jgi:hypothetical protein